MVKEKKKFFCKNCGSEFYQWMGKCNYCNKWNTLSEFYVKKNVNLLNRHDNISFIKKSTPISIENISILKDNRFSTKDLELDRVLGGGIVHGSIILAAGDPGIGKSTLFLQIALRLNEFRVLYISGEESESQIKLRANRLKGKNTSCFLLSEIYLEEIIKHTTNLKPTLVIIDSIQTLQNSYSENFTGSIIQIRQCICDLMHFAKKTNISIILIGHITKDGMIAGPKILEHIVDVVLQFSGDNNYIYRILRAKKNRFGKTSELAIYEMHDSGLYGISDPSKILTTQIDLDISGQTIAVALEGIRPMFIEIQSLVTPSIYGTPQRSSMGFDIKRLNMLLAVLEKRIGIKLSSKDIFLNITGGIRIEDPAIDLALIVSILSSYKEISISPKFCFSGEIGLSGEIRPVQCLDYRILEANRLGFNTIFVSSYNKISSNTNIIVISVSKIEEILKQLF